jgi:myo-inositol-1(or 4)-monophosphatase
MMDTRAFLEFATETAWQAGRLTLPYFQTGVDVERKTDGSPVTAADRAAEAHLRRLLEARFPDHDIVGEEMGASSRDSTHRWYIDPIDGTQSFVLGVPLYGVLLGLQVAGEMAVGVAVFPALGEVLAAASGHGCWWNGRPARVSDVARLAEASLSYTDCADLQRHRAGAWQRLQAATRTQRGWGDCYGHCLVATGRIDVMLDPIMSPWDCAALVPILREAGGTFTDWTGTPTIDGGDAISTNGALFDEVMEIVRGNRS